MAERVKRYAAGNTRQINKRFIDRINVNRRGYLFQRRHHAHTQIGIKRVIGTKNSHLLPMKILFDLKVRRTHFDAQPFGLF
ncbi:hypothetical protein D3C80_1906090 [compost metagenome]